MLHKKGRPTNQEQKKIIETLQKCYSRNYSPSFATKITGFNPKTIYKFYDSIDRQIKQIENKTFFEKIQAQRERINYVYDSQLHEYYQLLDHVNDEIKQKKLKNEETPRYLLNYKLKIMENISNLQEKKGSFLLSPPLDESIRQIVKEIIQGEHDKHN